MKIFKIFSLFSLLAFVLASCGENKDETEQAQSEESIKMEKEFTAYADSLIKPIKQAYKDYALYVYEANVSGDQEDYQKMEDAEKAYNKIFNDSEAYEKLKEFKESGLIEDPVKSRRLLWLFNEYQAKQIDPELLNKMTELSTKIQKIYGDYRAEVDGKKLSDNEVEEALKTVKESEQLKKVWEAHKLIGPEVESDLLELVKLRNQAAQKLGYDNFHDMMLLLGDQNPEDIEALFDELDELTREGYLEVKNEIDAALAEQYEIAPEELRPWHYQNRYFQEAPKIYEIDLDKYYEDQNIEGLAVEYYKSLGMPIDEMLANSSMYPMEGKNQHAFCIDIDRDVKDVRVLCNIEPNYSWMNTTLHEFGHAVYFYYIDSELPWILRQPAHTFTTEAIAMLFGRRALSPQYIQDLTGIDDDEKAEIADVSKKMLRMEQLIFSRWSQVMYRFEKSMYENPDRDLNKLWWDLVEKYQLVERPEGRDMPDWATKTHIANSPCYYHNYHLGELLASQLDHYIAVEILGKDWADNSFYNQPEVGEYLIKYVFKPGAKYYWNDMIEKACGEKLTAKYYAEQFVKVADDGEEVDAMPNEAETKIITNPGL